MYSQFIIICLVLPILFSIFVILAVYKARQRPIQWFRALAISAPIVLFLISCFWLSFGRYIPGQNVRLFETPISNIRDVQIEPDPIYSLVDEPLVVTNRNEIEEIMTAIRSATAYQPSHPGTRWACSLVISDLVGNSYVRVVNTPPGPRSQGTILDCETSKYGIIFSTLRSDTIGDTLEKVASENGADMAAVGWRREKGPTPTDVIFGLSLLFAATCYYLIMLILVIAVGIIFFLLRKKRHKVVGS
jgi:hypothetical protein